MTITELAERHPHPVFYCDLDDVDYEPVELIATKRIYADPHDGTRIVADCPLCGVRMRPDMHLEVCLGSAEERTER